VLISLIFPIQLSASVYHLPIDPPNDSIEVNKANSLHKQVVEEERTISSIDEALSVTLPVGIKKNIGNTVNIIVLETMKFTPDGATVTAYMSCEVPESEKRIALKGKDINFAPGGFTAGARLELLENVDIPLGEQMTLVVKGEESKTFVEWDCKGYKSMGLQGDIEFSREMLLPEGPDGQIIKDENKKVKASFETQLEGWDDLLVEVSITAFQHKDLKDFSIAVNSAVFDFSELANSPSMVFPKGYQSPDFVEGNTKMWKGFFLKDMIVRLPGNLSKDTVQRSTIEAHNMIIDNMGISGLFSAKNVIPKGEGKIGKWPFSLDEISAEITKNQMVSYGFNGTITVPPLSDTATLNYEAFIDLDNNYNFIVETQETLNMDMWAAKLRLDPNSYIDISVVDGKFKPKAVLNGALSIKNKETEIAGLDFERLELSPEKPYVKVESFSFGTEDSQQKFGKYPISISNIGMLNQEDRTGLKFDLNLNLVKSENAGFAGETGLTFYAKSYEENNRQKWKYDGFEVSKIVIDVNQGAFKLKGTAQWYKQDPVYGNGFSGTIDAEFKSLPKLEATAIFGNIDGMRYFYADALLTLKNGLPIFTGVNLYQFGGGIYHHMRQLGYNENSTSTIGKTESGIIYKPDVETLYGFKATVGYGLTKKEAFNADLTLEMAFNKYAGVNRIVFVGNGYFMTPPLPENAKKFLEKCEKLSNGFDPNAPEEKDTDIRASISAYTKLDFDFRNKVTHGNLSVYINMPGDVITGIGPNGRAGDAVMHFAPDEWYIHIGKPMDRIEISVLGLAELNSYFMMGTNIPASPPPPAKVSEILGGIDLNYMANENALGEGKGIAFGAGLNISTGKLAFTPFYAQFDAGAGFDVMLKNYGNVNCKGLSEPLGINGWYANGQVWAYIEGAIGIEVDWRFIKGNYEILRVGAAAVLQAKLPNPFWMHGVVGGRYSILGGLVSGNCRFDLTIGEECNMEGSGGSPVQGIEVIAEATPNDGSNDVNVFNNPQAIFNMPIGKIFNLQDMDGNDLSFKIELDHFQVKDGTNTLQGDLNWNSEKDVLAFNSFEILPPQKQLSLDVQVSFKEKVNGNWQTIMADGNKVIENMKTTFTTGEAPDYIPHENIVYSYPLINQFNYYQNETDIGYIQLEKGQNYLFVFQPGTKWKQAGSFTEKDGSKNEFSFSYNQSEKKIDFKRPSSLKNNKIYSFDLLNIPVEKATTTVDDNVFAKVEKKDIEIAENDFDFDKYNVGKEKIGKISTIEINTKITEGNLDKLEEQEVFTTHFRTSKYNTLSEKIDGMRLSVGSKYPIETGVHLLLKGIYGGEVFDAYETGKNNIPPLIKFENILDNKPWYKRLIYPYLYENYPLAGNITLKRNEKPIGIPPVNTIVLHQYYTAKKLTEDNIKYGYANSEIVAGSFYSYLIYDVYLDYRDLSTKVCSKYYGNNSISDELKYLINKPFPQVKSGDYRFKAIYTLPGINKQTSETILRHKVK